MRGRGFEESSPNPAPVTDHSSRTTLHAHAGEIGEERPCGVNVLNLGLEDGDRDNRVVIMTGTGDEWSGVRATPGQGSINPGITSNEFDRVHWEGRALLMNLLSVYYILK